MSRLGRQYGKQSYGKQGSSGRGQLPDTDLKFVSYASEAVLRQSSRASQLTLWSIMLFIVVMLVWAYFARIDEFTRANGKIVPSSDIQVVQNLEGGILANLMVQEGQVVEKGQPLLQIDDTIVASSYGERTLEAQQLTVKAARLRAEANGTSFSKELSKLQGEFDDNLVKGERSLFAARQQEYQSQLDVLNQKVKQKYQELSSMKVNKSSLSNSYKLLKKEVVFSRPLVADGAISKVEMLRLERQANDLKGELDRANLAIPQLTAALAEAKRNVQAYSQGFSNESRLELNAVMADLGRLVKGNEAFEDRVERTVVRSPMKGIVKQLLVKTVGGVIQPGMDLVKIVPFDDSLLVDTRVLPSDIAFIYPGQKATVKFTAYDFSIHGGVAANVVQISPDTIVDKEGNSFYQVRLKTVTGHVGKSGEPLPIIPGMTVQADILTGEKTMMDYLLKPILKTKQLAFRER